MTRMKILTVTAILAVLFVIGCASATQITVSDVQINSGDTGTVYVTLDQVPSAGLSGFKLALTINDPAIADNITSVIYNSKFNMEETWATSPVWTSKATTSTVNTLTKGGFQDGYIKAAEVTQDGFPGNLSSGYPSDQANVVLATLQVHGLSSGTTTLHANLYSTGLSGNINLGGPNYVSTTSVVDGTITVKAAPVANFTTSTTTPAMGQIVTFTDTSTGSPTSWLWDFGDGTTSSEQNPTHIYIAAGTYTVILTATNGIGSTTAMQSLVVASMADLTITGTVVPVPASAVFAKEANNVRVNNIKNNGSVTLTSIPVALYASDVSATTPVATTTIASLAVGATTSVVLTDPTVRSLAGGSITYMAVVDPDNTIPETLETNNNKASAAKSVVYNGYKGKGLYWEGGSNITTKHTYDLLGGVLTSTQPSSAYKAVGWTGRTETWSASDLPLPEGATVEQVWLYLSYNWDHTIAGSPSTLPAMTATFNGNPLTLGDPYTDYSNFGGYSYYLYGLYPIDVTSLYNPAENTLVMTPDSGNLNALYPSTLVVIYRDANETRKQIFINEECDELGVSDSSYGTTVDEATAYAPFSGLTIDPAKVQNAVLYSYAGSAGPSEGNLLFNGATIASNGWQGDSSSASPLVADVTNYLSANGNIAAIQGTQSGGMDALQQILVVEYAKPVPAFTADKTNVLKGQSVQFTDHTSGDPTAWVWDFGDGATSTQQNPTHAYAAAGTYTVTLAATSSGGSATLAKTDYITVSDTPTINVVPVGSGTMNPGETQQFNIVMDGAPQGLSGYDLVVSLNNTAVADIAAVSYDSTWAQMALSPTLPADSARIGAVDTLQKIYPGSTSGQILLATITLRGTATGTTGIGVGSINMDDDSGNGIIPVVNAGSVSVGTYAGPVAAFHGTPVSGPSPLAVQFTDDSTVTNGAITAWSWEFGDGTTSTEQNPSHTFSVGIYTVKLTVTAPGGTNSVVKTAYIDAGDVAPTAAFTTDVTTGNYPLTVHFTDISSGNVTSYAWNFGDGQYSSLKSPSHTYTYPGTFTARLTVTGPGGSNSATTTIVANNNGPVADFIANPVSGLAPLTVAFSDQSANNVTAYAWDFNNDGTIDSTHQNPTYTYTASGSYTVNLTVTGPGGTNTKIRVGYINVGGNIGADFIATPLNGVASRNVTLAVQFTDQSTGGPTSWSWNFGNGLTANSTEQNPVTYYSGRPQNFTVTLMSSSGADHGAVTKTQYISITPYLEKFPIYNSTHQITGYYSNLPADLNGDYVYEDINHNGRVDYDDVVAFFNALDWVKSDDLVDIENYDYSGNGAIGWEDVVALNDQILYH